MITDFKFTELEMTIVETFVNMAKPREEQDPKIGCYSFFDMGIFKDGIWADCLIDESGDPKVYRGVVSSLIKKGFLASVKDEDGTWVELTEVGGYEVASMAGVPFPNRWK